MISVLFVFTAGVLWGCMGILTRTMTEGGFSQAEITAFRAFITAAFMIVFLLIFKRKELKIKPKDIPVFLGTGIMSVAFFNICYFTCMKLTTLSNAAVLLYTAPTFVTVMSAIFFKEKINSKKIVCIIAAFAGCVLVSGGFDVNAMPVMGLLTGLGAGFGYALYSIFSRVAINKGYSSFTITTYTFIFAFAGCLFFIRPTHFMGCMAANASHLWFYALLVFMNTVLAYILYTKGLDGMENSTASIIASIEPIVATIVGITLFDEKLTIPGTIGTLLVLGSCVFAGLVKDKAKLEK